MTRNRFNSLHVAESRRKIKARAVEYKGGKCEACGYSKCIAALEFHHQDPTQKDLQVSGAGNYRKWEVIRPEVDKCLLLCANCHREEHDRLHKLGQSAKKKLHEEVLAVRAANVAERKALKERAIKNREKWPADEEMERLVWEAPVTDLAKRIGVTSSSVKGWCQRRHIETPPRGYWASFRAKTRPQSINGDALLSYGRKVGSIPAAGSAGIQATVAEGPHKPLPKGKEGSIPSPATNQSGKENKST